MYSTLAIRNMIRESKTHQLDAAIASGAAQGMRTMDMALADLVPAKAHHRGDGAVLLHKL